MSSFTSSFKTFTSGSVEIDAQIVTNLADQFLGIVEVDKGTRHDVRRLNQTSSLLTNG